MVESGDSMRLFALAIAALLLLSSCTDEPAPIEPKSSPTAKSPAIAPALPSEATKETPDGAIAFVNHWINVLNFAVNTGAVEKIRDLNDPKCKGCRSYEDQVKMSNRGGAEVRDFKWTGGKSSLSEERRLEATIRADDYQVRDSPRDEWSNVRGSTFRLGFELKWTNGRWVVGEMYVPESA